MKKPSKLTIACVLKTGGDFDKEYVDSIYHSLTPYLNGNTKFVCITDDPNTLEEDYAVPFNRFHLNGWWSKFDAFDLCVRKNNRVLLFDLDTIIRKDVTGMIDFCRNMLYDDTIVMLQDFYFPDDVASGIMCLTPQVSQFIIEQIEQYGIKNVMRDYRGDQEFLRHLIKNKELPVITWSNVLNRDYIVSYKAHVINDYPSKVCPLDLNPENSHIVCFHGKPRPRDIELDKSGVV